MSKRSSISEGIQHIEFMRTVAKDILKLKLKPSMTLKQVEELFYKVMRKYGIKEGMPCGRGRAISNFEWTMCKDLFLNKVKSYFEWDRFFIKGAPKDLYCY